MSKFTIIFDEVILKQLQKLKENEPIKLIISKMFDKIEEQGTAAGKLIDSQMHLYEMKNKKPPIRIYFKQISDSEILVFEYEIKKSQKKQNQIINKIKFNLRNLFKTLSLFL